MRVWAVNGTVSPSMEPGSPVPEPVVGRSNPSETARSTTDEPSGVGSPSDARAAARTSAVSAMPTSGVKVAACRLP